MYNGHLSIEELEEVSQQKGPAENQSHVENCRQCRELLEDCQAISVKLAKLASVHIGAGNGMNCPDPRVWLDVAAGNLSSDESLKYVQHATDCPGCGPKLRSATRLFAEELTPEEEKAISALPSASPKVQRDLAEKLAGVTYRQSQSVVIKPKRRFWRPLYVAFGTAAVLVLAVFLSLGPITDSLLAHGYKEQGTLELRIAKADPPKEGTRGTTLEAKERPTSLVLADLVIRTRLAFNSRNAHWLGEKGRLELIEGKPSAALQILRTAHSLDPKSKIIVIDLASATASDYSAHQQQPTELFQAQEELLKILPLGATNSASLQRDPNNLLAIYNLAIIYELMGSYPQAIQEWELYLKLDSNSAWATQARNRLEDLKKRKSGRSPPAADAPFDAWLEYLNSGESNATEAALDVALTEWLPNLRGFRASDKERSTSLWNLLLLLSQRLYLEHHDNWLGEALAGNLSEESIEGFQILGKAVQENASGDFVQAELSALKAQRLFRQAGNRAGLAGAQLEQVYSYQRTAEGESCIESAHRLEENLSASDFVWIRIQFYLDRASCFNLLGLVPEAKLDSDNAAELADKSRYKILSLRAQGIRASLATGRGDHNSALELDVDGLRTYWSDAYPQERLYQFYSDTTFNTEAAGLWNATYEIGHAAVNSISQTPHKEIEALARYRLAKAALMAGYQEAGAVEIQRADTLFSKLPPNSATKRYRADGVVGVAQATFDIGQESQALSLLETSVKDFPSLESRLIKKRLFTLQGDLALRQGQLADAETAYDHAVELAESVLQEMTRTRERLAWSQENVVLYKDLAQVKLSLGDAASSLEIWEGYKAALIRYASPRIHDSSEAELKPEQALISYVFLPNGLTAWVFNSQRLSVVPLSGLPKDFRERLHDFIAECANPDSDLAALRLHAKNLYSLLIEPLLPLIQNARTLIIETDNDLETLPFEALVNDSGEYLIERFSFIYSPGILFQDRLRPIMTLRPSDHALVVGSPEISPYWKQFLAPIPTAKKESEGVAARFQNPVVLAESHASYSAVISELPNADLFHFAGHSIQTNSGVALVLSSAAGGDHDLLELSSLPTNKLQRLRLVVLSACSTGPTSGADLAHVIEPFLVGGVPQIILTRWDIKSQKAADFVHIFYQNLFELKATDESLHQTTLALARIPNSHPYYWAGFFLAGRQ